MYSNPSRFAPKVKKTGGEAYPQAPTMDQFYSYGAPTPHTPFVFQDGGNMMSFEDPKPNKVNSFLERIKQKGYEALQKEMEEESMMMGDAYDQASMEMDTAMMQWGGGWSGGYETNFDKANQWAEASEDDGDVMGAFANFAQAAQNFGTNPDDYYIKKMKYNYKPTAQYGMELQEFQGDVGSSQYNRDQALAQAAYLRNLPATASGSIASPFQMFNLPGAAQATVTSRGQKRPVRTIDRDAPIQMPSYYVGENSYAGYVPQPITASVRTTGRPGDGSILYDPNKMQGPFNPNWRPFQPIGGTQTTTTKEEQKSDAPRATSTKPTASANPAAPAAPPAAPETPAAGKPEEKPKDGTQPTAPETGAGAPENKTPQQVQQEAAQLGMSPQQYMTFITHADVKMGPLGRRLRKASFDFTTYGPGMSPVTASANQQKPFFYDNATGKMEGDVPGRRKQSETEKKDGFFKRVFGRPDEQERWNPKKGSKLEGKESLVGKSQFNPEGYADKNYMSDFRNERATDRLTRLGERIDRNIQRERSLDETYDANISNRMQRLRNRDERRYNRVADRFGREDYQDPRFRDYYAYGGYLKHYQDAGPVTFEDEYMPESVTDVAGNTTSLDQTPKNNNLIDYSGSDKPLSETYVGDIAPVDLVPNTTQMMGEKGKGKLGVKFGKKQNPYTKQFIGAGLDLLSAGLQNREASKNEKMFRNKMGADQVFTPMEDMSRGDYTANEGYFRPDQQVPTQFTGYNFESPYARMGGSYKKGGEYYLTQDEIDEIIAMGGQIEFLD
jgi:hypothetical protein